MIFIEHWVSWLILFSIIIVLIYTMKTVQSEAALVNEQHQVFAIGKFQILVPNWWTDSIKSSSEQTISFERTDTSYEWFAEFNWYLQKNLPTQELDEFLRQNMEREGMEFDLHEVHLTDKESYASALKIQDGTYTLFRIEGTATQDKSVRCYVDAFVLLNNETKEVLYAKSWSSILNGMLEGPYFEKVLFNIIELN